MPVVENLDDPFHLARVFQDAHQRVFQYVSRFGLRPMRLNLHATQEQVDHAGTNDSFQEIAVRLSGEGFADLQVDLAVGIIAHEYGHQHYRSLHQRVRGTPNQTEELACDYFAGQTIGVLRLDVTPFIGFLQAHRPTFGSQQYPPVQDSINAVISGASNALG